MVRHLPQIGIPQNNRFPNPIDAYKFNIIILSILIFLQVYPQVYDLLPFLLTNPCLYLIPDFLSIRL